MICILIHNSENKRTSPPKYWWFSVLILATHSFTCTPLPVQLQRLAWFQFFFFLYIRLISGQILLFIHHIEIMLNFELSQTLELCLLGECPPQFSVVLLKVSVTFSFCPLSLFWHWDFFLSLSKLHVENKHIFLFWLCLRCILVGKPSKR